MSRAFFVPPEKPGPTFCSPFRALSPPETYPAAGAHRMDQQEAGSEGVLKGNMEERAERLALYIIENRSTVRAAAQRFGISKSTVHKDISERLPLFNRPLYMQVKAVLDVNKAQRHIRGGIATRKKYRGD